MSAAVPAVTGTTSFETALDKSKHIEIWAPKCIVLAARGEYYFKGRFRKIASASDSSTSTAMIIA